MALTQKKPARSANENAAAKTPRKTRASNRRTPTPEAITERVYELST